MCYIKTVLHEIIISFQKQTEERKIIIHVGSLKQLIVRDFWEPKASVIYSELHTDMVNYYHISMPDKTHIWVIVIIPYMIT